MLENFLFKQVFTNNNFVNNVFKHFFKQLFDRVSCTYSYLLADASTKEAVLIDPVIDLAERDAKIINDLGLTLKYSGKF